MKVQWVNHKNKIEDITNYISSVTWTGSATQASRSLQISVLYSPLDKNIKDLDIKMGDRLILYEDGKLLINAMVYSRERVSEQGTITYSGYDEFNRLLKSNGSYNFKNTTPGKIANKICNDLQIETGEIEEPNVPIPKLLIESDNYYNILMKAYTKAYKSLGVKYMPLMYNKKLYIKKKGELIKDFILKDDVNITSSSYSESIDSIINKVKIYKENGKQAGEVNNENSINLYGIFQDIYSVEEGVNPITIAKNMLVGEEKTASLEALGHTSCISGFGVRIKDSITGLVGVFWIENDCHTWSNGAYTMSLDLAFKNVMDIQED